MNKYEWQHDSWSSLYKYVRWEPETHGGMARYETTCGYVEKLPTFGYQYYANIYGPPGSGLHTDVGKKFLDLDAAKRFVEVVVRLEEA